MNGKKNEIMVQKNLASVIGFLAAVILVFFGSGCSQVTDGSEVTTDPNANGGVQIVALTQQAQPSYSLKTFRVFKVNGQDCLSGSELNVNLLDEYVQEMTVTPADTLINPAFTLLDTAGYYMVFDTSMTMDILPVFDNSDLMGSSIGRVVFNSFGSDTLAYTMNGDTLGSTTFPNEMGIGVVTNEVLVLADTLITPADTTFTDVLVSRFWLNGGAILLGDSCIGGGATADDLSSYLLDFVGAGGSVEVTGKLITGAFTGNLNDDSPVTSIEVGELIECSNEFFDPVSLGTIEFKPRFMTQRLALRHAKAIYLMGQDVTTGSGETLSTPLYPIDPDANNSYNWGVVWTTHSGNAWAHHIQSTSSSDARMWRLANITKNMDGRPVPTFFGNGPNVDPIYTWMDNGSNSANLGGCTIQGLDGPPIGFDGDNGTY